MKNNIHNTHIIRKTIVSLLLFAGITQGMWAANTYYIIVNGQGETVVSSDNTSGKGLNARLRSPYATNYRYYESLTDAQADATSDTRTNVITNENDLVTTDKIYYVRYDYQTYSGSGTALDLSGNTWYTIKANTSYMYLNTNNSSLPIASTTSEDDIALKQYHWKVVAETDGQGNPDPYNIKLYNRAIATSNPDYVLTGVKTGGTTLNADGNNKTAVLYCKDDGTAENAGLTFQRFILTQASSKQTTWQLIGVYEYPELNGSPQYYTNINNPGGAHTAQYHYIRDDNPVSATRVWNAQDGYDKSQLTIAEAPALSVSCTYHLINLGTDGTGVNRREILYYTTTNNGTLTASLDNTYRSPLVQEYRYYKASAVSVDGSGNYTIDTSGAEWTEGNTIEDDVEHVYVTYVYDASSAAVKLNSLSHYNVKINGKYLRARDGIGLDNETVNYANNWSADVYASSLTGTYEKANGEYLTKSNYCWALEGNDPYYIRLFPAKYPNYYLAPGDTDGTSNRYYRLFKRTYSSVAIPAYSIFSNENGGYELRFMNSDGTFYSNEEYLAQNTSSRDYPDRNEVTNTSTTQRQILLTPVYMYHVVNKQGNVAISKRDESLGATLSIPADLKSPYIPTAGNYKFFNTQAEAYAYSSAANATARSTAAATAITTSAALTGTDIYVGYYYDETEKPDALPDLSGSVYYQMKNMDNNNYLRLNDAGTQAIGTNTNSTANAWLWSFANNDPYNISIHNKVGKVGYSSLSSLDQGWYKNMDCGNSVPSDNNGSYIMLTDPNTGYYDLAQTRAAYTETGSFAYIVYLGIHSNTGRATRNNSETSARYVTDRDLARWQFTSVAMGKFRFVLHKHVTTKGDTLQADAVTDYASSTNTITLPAELVRKYASSDGLFYTTYTNGTFSGNYTTFKDMWTYGTHATPEDIGGDNDYVTIHVDYTTSMPFTTSATYTDATWYRLTMNDKYMYLQSEQKITYDNSENIGTAYQFAVTGDPYELKIWSREIGSGSLYLGVLNSDSSPAASGNAIYPMADNGDNIVTWELVDYTGYTNEQFRLRQYGTTASPMYCTMPGGYGDMKYSNDPQKTRLVAMPYYTYTYNIVDNEGRIAIKYTLKADEKQMATKALGSDYTSIPEAIRSPYLEGETITFYDTFTENNLTSLEGHAITTAPETDNADIYVRYTTSQLIVKPLHLRRIRTFNMLINGHYLYDDGNGSLTNDALTEDTADRSHMWFVGGNDPYAATIENLSSGKYLRNNAGTLVYDTETDGNRFIIMKNGANNGDALVEMMAATGADLSTANYLSIGRDAAAPAIYGSDVYEHDATQLLIRFAPAQVLVVYDIIDKQGHIVVADIPNESSGAPQLPTAWISPLAKNYRYWTYDDFDTDGVTFTLHGNPTEVQSLSETTNGHIYVTYDAKTEGDEGYRDINAGVDYATRIARSTTDNTQVRNAAQWGKMYRLEFTSSQPYQLENGSDWEDTNITAAGTHLYPYTNGDGSFYIYTENRWNTQKDAAASTRTRWTWYLLSPNNDPYRVMITSWQNSHARSGKNYYSFFHTYYDDTLGEVLTNNVTDDERTLDSHGSRILPTEYMILGGDTSDEYLLKTSDTINGSHQTVNSFEQYWRNNPTVQRKLGMTTGSGEPTAAQKESLIPTWHSYNHYVNSTPWNGGSKSYNNDEHWFMTVRMGTGSFKLQETEMNAALILVDNHGWEVMRRNIYKKDSQTDLYNASKAELKKFDSPMVAEYHYYINAGKLAGYHKYTFTDNNLLQSGTSLGDDYPQSYQGGMIRDLYVTYTVKPEYAEGYDAATGNATAYLVQQGTTYAAADGSSISAIPVASTDLLTAGDEMLWLLQRNTDIDTEMGYRYEGESDVPSDAEPKDKAGTEAEYTESQQGLDPYNLQLRNKQTNGYLNVQNIDEVNVSGGSLETTYSGTMSIALVSDPQASTVTGEFYDNPSLRVTGSTFMAIADDNGNIRLMPRFDHSHVMTGLTTLDAQDAAAPAGDETAARQTTLFKLPAEYTYIIIDNDGNEALRFTSKGDIGPRLQPQYTSPFAKDFTFYKSSTLTDGDVINSLARTTLTDGKIYVRYEYDAVADTRELLNGAWLSTQINTQYVQYADGAVKSGTHNSSEPEWQWRLAQSSSEAADPYSVKIYNHTDMTNPMSVSTPDGGTVTANASGNYTRFALLPWNDSTETYALALCGTETADAYYFLNGSSIATAATTAAEADFKTSGTISNAAKVTFTDDITPSTVTYKIITHTGKVALSGTDTPASPYTASLPWWMQSPAMLTSAYEYYGSATGNDADGYTVAPDSKTTSLRTLDDGETVYVRYQYNNDTRKPIDYGSNFRGIRKNTSDYLDLSGSISNYLLTYDYYWDRQDNNTMVLHDSTHCSVQRISTAWLLTGNDPYEITVTSLRYDDNMKITVKEPAQAGGNEDVKILTGTDEEYRYNTFMVLKSDDEYEGLVLAVTGREDLFFYNSSGNFKLYKSSDLYSTKRKQNTYVTGQNMRFQFQPAIVYEVITNEGKTAMKVQSEYNVTTLSLPEWAQSPLLRPTDFTYYTRRPTVDNGTMTLNGTQIAAGTEIADLYGVTEGGQVYVRYSYDPANSPFDIATGFDDSSNTKLNFNKPEKLTLDGSVWYNVANMLSKGSSKDIPKLFGTLVNANNQPTDRFSADTLETVLANSSLSNRKYLWKLDGNDPYAIRMYSAYSGSKCLSSNGGDINFAEYGADGYSYQSFMFLGFVGTDENEQNKSSYALKRWFTFIPTGWTDSHYKLLNLSPGSNGITSLSTTAYGNNNSSTYSARIGANEVMQRSYISDGGNTWSYTIEFIKAPSERNYIFHAMKADGSALTNTWTKMIARDMLTPARLTDDMKRMFCEYEQTAGTYTADGTGRFYSDSTCTTLIVGDGHDGFYPEIGANDTYNVYFKYQTLDNDAIAATGSNFQYSSTTNITEDIEKHAADANVKLYDANTAPGGLKASWYMMNINLNDQHGTNLGRYFMRYEPDLDNEVRYLTDTIINDQAPKHQIMKAIQQWKGKESDPFQEGRWLFAFTGDPYTLKVVNMQASTAYDENGNASLGALSYVTATADDNTLTQRDNPMLILPESTSTLNQWGIYDIGNAEGGFALNLNSTNQGNQTVDRLYWYFDNTPRSLCGNAREGNTTSNAIKLLPYEPCEWIDEVNIHIRKLVDGAFDIEQKTDGTLLHGDDGSYTALNSRYYSVGDNFSVDNIPYNLKRRFCNYIITTVDENGAYTGDALDQSSAALTNAGGDIYLRYEVTSYGQTLFTTREAAMSDTLTNVWFMDFPLANTTMADSCGIYGQHAYVSETEIRLDNNTTTRLYNSTPNRLVTAPDRLKWFLVGDPYALQVYSTHRLAGYGTKPLWRVSTNGADNPHNWQYRNDCADLNGEDDVWWEMVDPMAGDEDLFALRFKVQADHAIQFYQGMYYYLSPIYSRPGYWNATTQREENKDVNLSFSYGNTLTTYDGHADWHTANGTMQAIRLVKPAKIYATVHETTTTGTVVTRDELSEYYGVGETITDLPQHLKRAYCNYFTNNATKRFSYAINAQTGNHFDCAYTVQSINPFYESAEALAAAAEANSVKWYDMRVGNYMYYDKQRTTAANGTIAAHSNYGTMKGYHWAFIGTPYSFQAVNRRQYDDGSTTYRLGAETVGSVSRPVVTVGDCTGQTDWAFIRKKTGSDFMLCYSEPKTTATIPDVADDGGAAAAQTSNFHYVRNTVNSYAGFANGYAVYDYGLDYTETFKNFNEALAHVTLLTVKPDQGEIGGDNVDNDCFDGFVKIWDASSTPKRLVYYSGRIELPRNSTFAKGLPYDARRDYCYYPAEGDEHGYYEEALTNRMDAFNEKDGSGAYRLKDYSKYQDEDAATVHAYYTYDDTYFSADAENMNWVNGRFDWSVYVTTSSTYTVTELDYDHPIYTYNENTGLIETVHYPDTVKTKTVTSGSYDYKTGWASSPNLDSPGSFNTSYAYGKDLLQTNSNQLKWALVGDPYGFRLTNYTQYLKNQNVYLTGNGTGSTRVQFADVTTGFPATGAMWTIKVNNDGKTYLALVNEAAGETEYTLGTTQSAVNTLGSINGYVSFTRESNAGNDVAETAQFLRLTGGATTDYTANAMTLNGAKAFTLNGLLQSVKKLIYHLVIDNTGNTVEIPYRKKTSDALSYTNVPGTTQRNLTLNPIADYEAEKVGVGNILAVPQYMRRPFCNYTFRVAEIENVNGLDMTEAQQTALQSLVGTTVTEALAAFTDMKVTLNVVYSLSNDVKFAKDSSTKGWYTYETMTDGTDSEPLLANFTYQRGSIATAEGRDTHYTNDYLWAPEGDPYGFLLHNRYATKNHSGWTEVMTTAATPAEDVTMTLTTPRTGNSVMEMLMSNYSATDKAFLTHPVAANDWLTVEERSTDNNITKFSLGNALYLYTDGTTTSLKLMSHADAKRTADASWRLNLSKEQLLPYFSRAGYVGGLKPDVARANQPLWTKLQAATPGAGSLSDAQTLVYDDANTVPLNDNAYYRIHGLLTPRYISGYTHLTEQTEAVNLHFHEVREAVRTRTKYSDLENGSYDETPATRGDIELLPVEYDPSSIWYFEPSGAETTVSTQGLYINTNAGNTKMTDTPQSLDWMDIGGAVVTLRDDSDIRTGYLDINADKVHTIKTGTANELEQSTKWCLQPVGDNGDRYHNQMPLRLQVNTDSTYWYASLCVPFDVKLSSTVNTAFIAPAEITSLQSVGKYNGKGNGQFVPALTPVIIRAINAEQEGEGKHYITMTVPTTTPTAAIAQNLLRGQLLEQLLVTSDKVMTYGMPKTDTEDWSVAGDGYIEKNSAHVLGAQPASGKAGFYTNANLYREAAANAAAWPNHNRYVYNNKAYYTMAGSGGAKQSSYDFFAATFDGEDIMEVTPVEQRNDGNVYDLSGRRVATEQMVKAGVWQRNLSPGIYIINGRKVKVK